MNLYQREVLKKLIDDPSILDKIGPSIEKTTVPIIDTTRVCDKLTKRSIAVKFAKLAYREILDIVPDSDLSVDFDCENFTTKPESTDGELNKILGAFILEKRPLIGCYAGGDWEYPVYLVAYIQDGKWRIYIPKKGNVYNHDTMKAFGNGEDYNKPNVNHDLNFLKKIFPKEMKGISYKNYDNQNDDCQLMWNIDEIKQDIIENIHLAF